MPPLLFMWGYPIGLTWVKLDPRSGSIYFGGLDLGATWRRKKSVTFRVPHSPWVFVLTGTSGVMMNQAQWVGLILQTSCWGWGPFVQRKSGYDLLEPYEGTMVIYSILLWIRPFGGSLILWNQRKWFECQWFWEDFDLVSRISGATWNIWTSLWRIQMSICALMS